MLTKNDQEVTLDEALKYVQTFLSYPPLCDEEMCTKKAKNFFARSNGKAVALCTKHEALFKNATVGPGRQILSKIGNFIRSR